MLLSAEKIVKSYSEKNLLNGVSLYIDKGDKIGVIGANGAGKSTFLRILAQAEESDAGVVTQYPGVRLQYLPQNPIWNEEQTVLGHRIQRQQRRFFVEYRLKRFCQARADDERVSFGPFRQND